MDNKKIVSHTSVQLVVPVHEEALQRITNAINGEPYPKEIPTGSPAQNRYVTAVTILREGAETLSFCL